MTETVSLWYLSSCNNTLLHKGETMYSFSISLHSMSLDQNVSWNVNLVFSSGMTKLFLVLCLIRPFTWYRRYICLNLSFINYIRVIEVFHEHFSYSSCFSKILMSSKQHKTLTVRCLQAVLVQCFLYWTVNIKSCVVMS